MFKKIKKLSQRKNFLINPKFQLRFISFTTILSFTAILIMYFTNYYFFEKLKSRGVQLGLPRSGVFFQYIDYQNTILNRITALTAGLLFVIIFIAGLLFSHRIAGPLYRFKKHLDAISNVAELKEVEFRQRDFFPEIAEAFNQFCSRISKK